MARILFVWELGANSGHWAHIKSIAENLATTGHDVYAALRKVNVAKESLVSGFPITFLQAPHLSAPVAEKISGIRSLAHILHNIGFYETDVLAASVTAWRSLYARVKPDLIIFEHSPTALLAAQGVDCKRMVLGDGFCLPPPSFPLPDLQPWKPSVEEQLVRDEQQVLQRVNNLPDRLSIPALRTLSQLYEEVDERVQPNGDRAPSRLLSFQ